jgi:DNA-binding beta-propeller fold protein YncE
VDRHRPEVPTGLAVAADDTVYVGDTDANAITLLKEGKVIDVIGKLQARPHNIAIDPGTGVLYLVDPDTPVYASNANPPPRGGSIKQVIKKPRS